MSLIAVIQLIVGWLELNIPINKQGETMNDEEKKKVLEHLEYILKGIELELLNRKLFFKIEYSKNGEKFDDGARIIITHPDLKYFKVEIYGYEWNDKSRARICFEESTSVGRPYGKYPDGTDMMLYTKYYFHSYIPWDDLERIGVPKMSYSFSLSHLNVSFKATKNIKLILRDILPAIDKYIECMKIAEPGVDEHIAQNEEVLNFQNFLAKNSGYSYIFNDLKDRDFKFPFGRVTVSSNGDATLKCDISKEEITKLVQEMYLVGE